MSTLADPLDPDFSLTAVDVIPPTTPPE